MTLKASIAALLAHDKVLSIYQGDDDGLLIISSSTLEVNDDGPFFVPEQTLISRKPLEIALDEFHQRQSLLYVEGFAA